MQRAQERTDRLLDRIDRYIRRHGLTAEVEDPARPAPIDVGSAPAQVDLADRKIATVLWATGFERRYPWLPAAALDAHGAVRHHHGIGVLPGLYVVGLRFQRSRSSNFISGVGRDAQHLVDHLTERPAGVQPCVA